MSAFTKEDLEYHARWQASSGHPGGWRVTRKFYPPMIAPNNGTSFQELLGPKGRVRLFHSYEAAKLAADKANA